MASQSDLHNALRSMPALDAHTHLIGGRLGAQGLHDILLYHMAVSDLYAAGCPSGERLTQFPGYPSRDEGHARIREALPYLDPARNTSTSWGTRIVLGDLYDWHEPVTESNWVRLDDQIRERAGDRSWQREILNRAGVVGACTEIVRRETDQDDDILQFALEWAFFTRCQWNEYDTAVYELERCWGVDPSPPTPIGGASRPRTDRTITTLDDVHEAIAWYVEHIPGDRIAATATHLSTDIDYLKVDDAAMQSALARRSTAGAEERNVYASYIHEAFLNAFEEKWGNKVVFQFSLGAEPLPFETGSRLRQETLVYLADMIAAHPGIHFQCFSSSAHADQTLCTLCRELPNLSLAGYWWHSFFPSIIAQIMDQRLDMLPLNKQIGFFSDAYCLEWVYAKSVIVRSVLAEVLDKRVKRGQYSYDDALNIAQRILLDTPKTLLSWPT